MLDSDLLLLLEAVLVGFFANLSNQLLSPHIEVTRLTDQTPRASISSYHHLTKEDLVTPVKALS